MPSLADDIDKPSDILTLSLLESSGQDEPQITLITEPQLPLLWYESTDSPFLLQVQKDAFFVYWRRQPGNFPYPHFHTREGGEQGVWDHFVSEWEAFRAFCEKQAIGTPEVCYLAISPTSITWYTEKRGMCPPISRDGSISWQD
jgi:hypothetical protein